MADYLPDSHGGYLPYFLLFESVAALVHSAVCYLSPPSAALRQFSGPASPPPSALLAHNYGLKNIYTGCIRAYAAYNITSRPLYELAAITFAGVLWLYISEMFVYRTVRLREAAFPFVGAGGGLAWVVLQKGWYLG